MRKYLFIFPHQDDEVFVFPLIEEAVRNGDMFQVSFLTHGLTPEAGEVRNRESVKALMKIGVRSEQVKFVGQELGIRNGRLCFRLSECFALLESLVIELGENVEIITTSYEGGHQDHDAAAILAHKLNDMAVVQSLKFFSTYNGYKTWGPFYRVSHLFSKPHAARIQIIPISFHDKWKILRSAFSYPSQTKAWVLLSPFLMLKLLLARSIRLEIIEGPLPERPHLGRLLYERHRRMGFDEFQKNWSSFKSQSS